MDEKLTKRWTKEAKRVLLNRKIVDVRYLTEEEVEAWGWYKRAVTFILDDGSWIVAQQDDEGNDGGVLWFAKSTGTEQEEQGVLPVL